MKYFVSASIILPSLIMVAFLSSRLAKGRESQDFKIKLAAFIFVCEALLVICELFAGGDVFRRQEARPEPAGVHPSAGRLGIKTRSRGGVYHTREGAKSTHLSLDVPHRAGKSSSPGLFGPLPPGTLRSLHTPLQTTPALFPRKREITPACLFIPSLGTRSPKGPAAGRPWVGGGGLRACLQPTLPFLY